MEPGRMKVLVIGAAGAFGGTTARALLSRGHQVVALMRPGGRLPDVPGAEVRRADALDRTALSEAADGVDAIVFGFHLPYDRWFPTAIEAARVSADVAAERGAAVLFPGNVYGLGPSFEAPLSEECPRHSPSRKGAIRNAMEDALREATLRGARALVVRAGDYLDPRSQNTWLEIMVSRALRGGSIVDPGAEGVAHAWAYLPDVVAIGVELLEQRERLAAFEVVHVEGYAVTSAELIDAIRLTLRGVGVKRFPWWLVRAARPFSRMAREVHEMRYLWTEPLTLDGGKLRRLLPGFRTTPLERAVAAALEGIAQRQQSRRLPAQTLQRGPHRSRLEQHADVLSKRNAV